MKKISLSLFALFCALIISCGQQQPQAEEEQQYEVTINTTEGPITVALYNDTPLHRDNFVQQAEAGYFDSTLFHRVIRDFMIQGGDPTSKQAKPGQFIGNEGPEPTVPAEFRYPTHFHKRGALAAARESDDVNPKRESSGYQFYIVCGRTLPTDSLLDMADSRMYAYSGQHITPALREYYRNNPGTPHLDASYTIFGEVIDGMDIVEKIQTAPTDSNDRPLTDVRILGTTINKK
ncbi:MAG: peptidylprolyl isomerase [Bacteroidales bacterium]|nr:peptidylprolyl isomerase [Bacteroidales bacterium]